MASSSSSLPDAAPVAARSLEYVGFWKRLVASIIDSFIVMVIVTPITIAVYGLHNVEAGARGGLWSFVLNVLLVIATLVFWRYRGATPGKMAISAKIVDAKTLGPAKTGQLVVRFFAYIVSSVPLGLGFLWIAIDRRKQGFHDKIAGTLVVYDDD
ncbi:MAG: RDD family protein [Betaproteobacteria bacterium]|nr:RDD family protein [Betaproteobacteria bacterium]